MKHLKITGIPPYDGEYPLDMARFTNRDWHTVKTITGYMPLDLQDAAEKGDTAILVAFSVIVCRHSGRFGTSIDVDKFWDATPEQMDVGGEDDEEAVDGPPMSAPETPTTHSGAPSPTVSEPSPVRSLGRTGTDT